MEEIPDLLAPTQLFGRYRGMEAAVYATRIYRKELPLDHVIMKVEFKNGFNSIRRDKMLAAVEEFIPKLLPFIHSAYCSPSFLLRGEDVINSSEECNRRLGPLFFC